MKHLRNLSFSMILGALCVLTAITIAPTGCASANRTVYNTLSTVKATTDTAFSGYLDLVIKKAVSTNSFPTVTKDYQYFQAAWVTALTVAQFATNAFSPADVTAASLQVITDINKAKGLSQ